MMNEKRIHEHGDIHLRLATEILREFLKPQHNFDSKKSMICDTFQGNRPID